MRVAIYARVSTIDKGQDTELQLTELRRYAEARGWDFIEYTDNGFSGAKDQRPSMIRMMNDARQRKFDALLVWKLDRFGRSLQHLVNSLNELRDLGISFISLRESIDLSTASGKLMTHIIAAFAEFERDMISERVRAGIANAKAKGKRVGRRPIAQVKADKIIVLYKYEKLSVRKIAKRTKVSPSSVSRIINAYKNG